MSLNTNNKSSNTKTYIIAAIVVLFMFGFRFIPPFGGITKQGMAVAGIMIGLIIGWAADSKCMAWTSILGLVALSTTEYGGISQVLVEAFGTTTVVSMFITMLIVGAVLDAKVDMYLIKSIMGAKWAQGRPWLITLLLTFGPFILSIFILGVIVALFLLPIYAKIFKEVGYKAGDKYVINVYIGMFISLICGTYVFPFMGSPLIYGGLVQGYMGSIWTNAGYMLTVSPFIILMCILYTPFMRFVLRCDASKMAAMDMSVFGESEKISNHQKGVLYSMYAFIIGALIISFCSGGANIISRALAKITIYGWIIIVAVAMMVIRIDGKRLMNLPEAAKQGVHWDAIYLVASATLIAKALTVEGTGIGAFMTGLASPILGGLSTYPFVIVLCAIAIFFTNIANNVAVRMIALTLCGAMIAGGMPLNGTVLGIIVLLTSTMGLVLPSSSMYGAFLHTAELATPSSVIKNATIAMIYVIICVAVIYVPLCMLVY